MRLCTIIARHALGSGLGLGRGAKDGTFRGHPFYLLTSLSTHKCTAGSSGMRVKGGGMDLAEQLQNELALNIDLRSTNVSKYEMVVFATENITATAYAQATENPEIEASHLTKYDPAFWKDYTIMEPNAAILAFEAVE